MAVRGHTVTLGRAEARKFARLHPRYEPARAPRWVQALVGYVVLPAILLAIAISVFLLLHG